jgi:acetolactate synthase-1/2/3 large subunit
VQTKPSDSREAAAVHSRSGADIVIRALEDAGIELCFGMPGGAILPIYDALARGTSLRHVLVRHEQGAGHMAQGYARVTGRPAAVLATSGPGATNLVTPIADAQMDSTPLVCITGQVRSDLIGTDAFQECDIVGVTQGLVKHSIQVRDVADLETTVHDAVAIATAGRPGPVLVDIPRDIQEAKLTGVSSRREAHSAAPAPQPPERQLHLAADLINHAARPVLYVGGGAQGSTPELLAVAEWAAVPVVTTLMGKGAFPDMHELFVGCPGMHGARAANLALHGADLLIATGARFDDRVTGRLDAFAPGAQVIHIDVDPYEHHKIRHADIPIHGELTDVLTRLLPLLAAAPANRGAWLEQLATWRSAFPLATPSASPDALLKPQQVVRDIVALTADHDDVIWTTGVGQHQMWAMQHVPVQRPRSFVSSGGLGTMGFGLPAAIGAQLARPHATVICIDGDGSFQMTLQELGTAVAERLPILVLILNNGQLGMIGQWQGMFYDGRFSSSDLRVGMPDFATIARGFGALGYKVERPAELRAAVREAIDAKRPAVIDVQVDPAEGCFPMIVPGGGAHEQVDRPVAPS